MSTSRLILIGVCAVGITAVAWLFLSKDASHDLRGAAAARATHDAVLEDAPSASQSPPAFSEVRGASSGRAEPHAQRPTPEPATGFSRRQEFERNGYEAAGQSLDAALKSLAGIKLRADHVAFLRGIFMRLGEGNSMEAIGALKRLKNGDDYEFALRAFVEAGHLDAPNRFPDQLFANTDDADASLILRLADQPDLAAGLARELLDGPALAHLLGRLATDAVAQDPQRALAFGDGLQGKERAAFLGDFAKAWAAADGRAAWAWALQQPDAESRESMQEAVIGGLADSDPVTAAQRLAQLPPGPGRDKVLQQVGETWGRNDTQAAFNWAGSLPNPQDRDAALASIRNVAPTGIGAVLRGAGPDGYPMIMEVTPGGAASALPQLGQGVQIVAVRDAAGNVIDLQGKDMSAAVGLLRGAPNTPVTMDIIPAGGTVANRQTVVLTRKQLIFKR